MTCDQCGKEFDPAKLDEVMFHAGDHTPIVATGIEGHQVEQPDTDDLLSVQHLSRSHRTTMTQNQRKELVRILSMAFEKDKPYLTLEQLAGMNDRQVGLAWLRMCDYITEGQYQREFEACVGLPVFLTRDRHE